MPYTMRDLVRDSRKATFKEAGEIGGEELRELLEVIPTEKRLEGIPREQLWDLLFPKGQPITGLTPEMRAEIIRRLQSE